jgi:hypothetical protein
VKRAISRLSGTGEIKPDSSIEQTTEWEYGLAQYNGWMQPDGTMADVIGGRSVGLREFLEAAAEKGWEFCGVLPPGDPLMAAQDDTSR